MAWKKYVAATTTVIPVGNVLLKMQQHIMVKAGVMEYANGMNMVSSLQTKTSKIIRLNGEYIFISWVLELKLGRFEKNSICRKLA